LVLINEHSWNTVQGDNLSVFIALHCVPYGSRAKRVYDEKQDYCHSFNSH